VASPTTRISRLASIATCATLAVAVGIASQARTADTIGSPHKGDTPRAWVPSGLQQASAKLGFRISVEVFPTTGFAQTFLDAVRRNAAPAVVSHSRSGIANTASSSIRRSTARRGDTRRR
jgi:hypothetical protein